MILIEFFLRLMVDGLKVDGQTTVKPSTLHRLPPLLILFLLLSSLSLFSQEKTIDLTLKDIPLETLILRMESEYQLLFSYKEEDIQGQVVSSPEEAAPLSDFLNFSLKGTGLQYELINGNYVLLSKVNSDLSEAEKEKPLPILKGRVVDQLTQEPLPFANVFLQHTTRGTSTDAEGNFLLQTAYDVGDTLIFSYVGYQEKRILAAIINQNSNAIIGLDYVEFLDDFVLVTDYLTDGISLNQNGVATTLRPNQIGALPGQAEPDVLSTIHFLPGISSVDGAASSICIRGGTPDQNLILWEEIPIYHSAHYFGMISAFNPYIIDKISIYRGGFDAEYGGRVSGVIDLKSQEDLLGKSNFGVGANFINVFGNGKVSLLKDKASVIFSVRRSIANLWRTPTFQNITRRIHQGVLLDIPATFKLPNGITIGDDFTFFDSNVKVNYKISPKDKLSAAWFYSENNFSSLIEDDVANREQWDSLYLESKGTSIAWTHHWKPGFSTKLSGLSTDYHYDYEYFVNTKGKNGLDKSGKKNSSIKERQINLLNTYSTKEHHQFKMGYQLVNYDVAFQIEKEDRNNPRGDNNSALISNVHALYADFNSNKDHRIGINVGMRWSYFEKENKYYPEPRLRLWYKPSPEWNFSLSAGKYNQYLSQLVQIQGDRSSIETPVWALAGEKEVPVLEASQFQLGSIFQKNTWLFDIQAYFKKINGLTSLATGFDGDLSGRFHLGNATIRGVDVLLKKRWKKYRTWISYSLSKVDHRFPSFFDPDFDAPNDQPHKFRWVHLWTFGQLDCSLGWKIKSGTPYSNRDFYRIRVNEMGMGPREIIEPLVYSFNSERLPAQHQLDASVMYHILPKNKGKWKAVIGLSIFNIYQQNNLYKRNFFIDLANEKPQLRYVNKADLGITPNVVMRLEW